MSDARHEDLVELFAQLVLEDIRLNPEGYARPRQGRTVTPPPVKPRAHLRLVDGPGDEPAALVERAERP
jgi:hypothetical protein